MPGDRTIYTCEKEEDAEKLRVFFAAKNLNPVVEHPEGAKVWSILIDAMPLLSKDGDQPTASRRHWMRPEYHQSYGHWFSPQRSDFSRCAVEVWHSGRGVSHSQCSKNAVTDLDYLGKPTRCTLHSRAKAAAKKEADAIAAKERTEVYRQKQAVTDARIAALDLIKQIAAGHNDARGAAQALLAEFGQTPTTEGENS